MRLGSWSSLRGRGRAWAVMWLHRLLRLAESKPPRFTTNLANLRAQAAAGKINLSQLGQAKAACLFPFAHAFQNLVQGNCEEFVFLKYLFYILHF